MNISGGEWSQKIPRGEFIIFTICNFHNLTAKPLYFSILPVVDDAVLLLVLTKLFYIIADRKNTSTFVVKILTTESISVPASTAEVSTAEDSMAEIYLPTTLRRSYSQNAYSTPESEKVRTLRWSFRVNNTYPTTCGP